MPRASRPASLTACNPNPQLLCWLTCDAVHLDPGTGKHTILGVFSNIKGQHFPVTHPFMVWFLTLTDCTPGQHKLRISMGLDPQAMQPLLERPFESQSPLHRINLINEIRNLSFPAPGDYSLLIEIDDEPLLRHEPDGDKLKFVLGRRSSPACSVAGALGFGRRGRDNLRFIMPSRHTPGASPFAKPMADKLRHPSF